MCPRSRSFVKTRQLWRSERRVPCSGLCRVGHSRVITSWSSDGRSTLVCEGSHLPFGRDVLLCRQCGRRAFEAGSRGRSGRVPVTAPSLSPSLRAAGPRLPAPRGCPEGPPRAPGRPGRRPARTRRRCCCGGGVASFQLVWASRPVDRVAAEAPEVKEGDLVLG